MKKNLFWQKGQSLIELLMAIGLSAILMPAFLIAFSTTRVGRSQQDQRIQAIAYMRETAEALRITRDNAWSNIATDGTYCPQPNGTTWQITPLPTPASTCSQPLAGFTRTITINDAYRVTATNALDPTGTSSTATDYDDPSTKAVTVSVSWSQPINSSVSEVLYFTRHDNLSYNDTNYSDFTHGDTSGGTSAIQVGTIDGDVVIGGGGSSDWCKPNAGGIVKYKQTGNGQEIAVSAVAPKPSSAGHAYTTFGNNQSGNPLDSINISYGTPATPSAGSSFTNDNIKTYGLYADPSSSYVYLTSDSNNITVDVVNTNDFSKNAATFKVSGENGNSVYVASISATYIGFVTTTKNSTYHLTAFKIGSTNAPSGTLSQQGSQQSLAGTGKRIIVSGNYAYVATSSTTNQLQIFDVTHIADASSPSMSPVTIIWNGPSINGSQGASPQGATDMTIDSSGKYLFLTTSYVDSSHPDVFIIDISNPSAPKIIGQTITNKDNATPMNPLGVLAVTNHLIVVGSSGEQYQVYLTSSPLTNTSPTCGGFTLSNGTQIRAVTGVSEQNGDNFAYIITDDTTGWFQIVPGGPGSGGGGSGSGVGTFTFVSQPLPVPTLAAAATFNSFFPIADTPNATSIKYQVSVASTCAGPFTFIGGSPASTTNFYATNSAVPISGPSTYQNPGRCFKYTAYLTTSSSAFSPVLHQVTVNWSP